TNTEKEAFLLENHLIKRHRPQYNVRLRDDKTYVSVRIDTTEDWPRADVMRRRKQSKNNKAVWFGPYSNAYAIRQTMAELENSVTLLANMVDTSLEVSVKNRLRGIAEKNREIAAHFHAKVERGLMTESEAQARSQEAFVGQRIGDTGYLYVIDSQGDVLFHPEHEVAGANMSQFAFVRHQMNRREGFIEYMWRNPDEKTPRAKALFMTYFEPWDWIISVSSYREEFASLISAEDFREDILGIRFGESGYAMLLDEHGDLLIHPIISAKEFHAITATNSTLIDEVTANDSGSFRYWWKNPGEESPREKIMVYRTLPLLDWYVAGTAYMEEYRAPLLRLQNILLLGAAPFLAILLLVTAAIASSITRPLREIMRGFAAGGHGNLSVRIHRKARDEAGQLARYFNQFMTRMQEYEQDLRNEIDERIAAVRALEKSEHRYRMLFESLQDAFALHELVAPTGEARPPMDVAPVDFRLLEMNPAYIQLTGLEPRRAIGRRISGLDHDMSAYWPRLYRHLAHCDMPTRFGDYAPELERYFHVMAYRPEENVIAVIIADVTEAKTAEEEMRRARNYVRSMIDSMPSVIFSVDLDGLVTQWNVEAEKLTGVMRDQALGRRYDTLWGLLERNAGIVEQALAESRPVTRSDVVLHDGDEQRSFEMMAYPLVITSIEGAVVRVDDVTQRMRMQVMLAQSEKMMSVGGLAAGMAHEINNPLGGIIQGVQNVRRRLLDDIPANRRAEEACRLNREAMACYLEQRGILEFIESIRESGERASRIVANMLEFSRTSAPVREHTPVHDLMEKALSLAASDYDLKKRWDFKVIEIERSYDEHVDKIPCSASEIEQVLLNLLKNAAQALFSGMPTSDGGPPRIVMRTRLEEDSVRIEIADNGPGMDRTTAQRIFEPFFTTKEVGEGTGLGLSVSYFIIVQNHGGDIFVDSSPGQGATFVIRLPLLFGSRLRP
ncbi:MAG: cache domain-containing protein, partial [Oceanidesulfovibrio sp.]